MKDNQNQNNEPAPAEQQDEQRDALTVAQRQINVLRDKLRHLDKQLAAATQNNSRLVATLEAAETEIVRLKSALERDGETPFSFATITDVHKAQPGRARASATPRWCRRVWTSCSADASCALRSARW